MTAKRGNDTPSSSRPDRLESTVEMDVRDHLKSSPPSHSPPTLMSMQTALAPMRALRVAVRPGSGARLEVQRLADDEPLPPGTQEALLVPMLPRR